MAKAKLPAEAPSEEKSATDVVKTRLIENLREELPPMFSRKEVCERLGGMITPASFANMDCSGDGPPIKVMFSNKVAYERDSFLDWFQKQIEIKETSPKEEPKK